MIYVERLCLKNKSGFMCFYAALLVQTTALEFAVVLHLLVHVVHKSTSACQVTSIYKGMRQQFRTRYIRYSRQQKNVASRREWMSTRTLHLSASLKHQTVSTQSECISPSFFRMQDAFIRMYSWHPVCTHKRQTKQKVAWMTHCFLTLAFHRTSTREAKRLRRLSWSMYRCCVQGRYITLQCGALTHDVWVTACIAPQK